MIVTVPKAKRGAVESLDFPRDPADSDQNKLRETMVSILRGTLDPAKTTDSSRRHDTRDNLQVKAVYHVSTVQAANAPGGRGVPHREVLYLEPVPGSPKGSPRTAIVEPDPPYNLISIELGW